MCGDIPITVLITGVVTVISMYVHPGAHETPHALLVLHRLYFSADLNRTLTISLSEEDSNCNMNTYVIMQITPLHLKIFFLTRPSRSECLFLVSIPNAGRSVSRSQGIWYPSLTAKAAPCTTQTHTPVASYHLLPCFCTCTDGIIYFF